MYLIWGSQPEIPCMWSYTHNKYVLTQFSALQAVCASSEHLSCPGEDRPLSHGMAGSQIYSLCMGPKGL